MALYTFFCRRPDGASTAFETYELDLDGDAAKLAEKLLRAHRSASHIEVRDGDRLVDTVLRAGVGQGLPSRLQALLEEASSAASNAALIATTFDGTVVYWNAAATRLYGWGEEEALGRNIVDVTPALQSREQAAAIMQRLQAGESWQGEIVLRRRDGTPFKAFVADVPVAHVEGDLIIGASAEAARKRVVRDVAPLLMERLAV